MNKCAVVNPMETPKRQHFAGMEQGMLQAAVDAVREETGLEIHAAPDHGREDGWVHIKGHIKWAAEIKKWAAHTQLAAIIHQLRAMPEPRILVADYVNPKMAERLKDAGIAFIDTAGNAYINQKPIYVYVVGKKPEKPVNAPGTIGKGFNQADLKIIYGLLCDAALADATYREIAETTTVALGAVGKILDKLKAAGFLIKQRQIDEWKLADKEKLIAQWVEQYPYKLRKKHALGIYFADNPTWWKDVDIIKFNGRWGGETAAAKLTKYLKPKTATVYIPKYMLNQLMMTARLRKANAWELDQAGRVEIYEAWENQPFPDMNHNDIAHPLLAYADLMATEDPRNMEAAKVLYDQYFT